MIITNNRNGKEEEYDQNGYEDGLSQALLAQPVTQQAHHGPLAATPS